MDNVTHHMHLTTPSTTLGGPEVRSLLEGLRARRAKTARDRAIAGRVRDVLESSDGPRARGLHFYVFEGAVSVYGAVSTLAERDGVMAAMTAIPGINQIADHLTVLGR